MSDLALLGTLLLPALAYLVSAYKKLGLEKDIVIGCLRAAIQLTIIGLLLKFIFHIDNHYLTAIILLTMVANAAQVASGRGKAIAHAYLISFTAISSTTFLTLLSLLACGTISSAPSNLIPVGGMIIGNSMVALGILYRSLLLDFTQRREEVEVKLCLGAAPALAARSLINDSIKTAMVPTIDSMKTLGIVQLPGMMTGMILAGVAPETAIKYQIMVAFMLAGSVTLTTFIGSLWAYRGFFNAQKQLKGSL